MINIKEFITQQEGIAHTAYRDASGYSIGVGHFLTKHELASGEILLSEGRVRWKDGLTDAQIDELLDKDIEKVAQEIKPLIQTELNPCQGAALISFVFNLGVGNFAGSTLLKRINIGQLDKVPNELKRWDISSGLVNQGLVRRRAAEAAIWLTKDCE